MIMNIRRFLKNRKGATAIEYGLIAAGIAVVIIGAVQLLGTNLDATFNGVADALVEGGGGGEGGGEGEDGL